MNIQIRIFAAIRNSNTIMLPRVYLILQNIRSLHNVGSIFRSADAFGVEKIYLCGYTGAPPHPDISKTALGAEGTVPWEKRVQTARVIEELRRQGVVVITLEKTGGSKSLVEIKSDRTLSRQIKKHGVTLILGNEVKGVTREILRRADAIAHIPMYGEKESLNVAVAAGIALYHLRNL